MPRRTAALACLLSLLLTACGDPEPVRRSPDVVPAPSAHGSDAPEGAPHATADVRFEERALEAGLDFHMTFLAREQGEAFKINLYDHGCGVAIADVDGDGADDVYLCNQLGANALFHNDGHGRFADVTATAGVGLADRISVAATFCDYDGDGDQDLYVTTTRGGNVLFANRGDGTFEDVTARAGLTLVAHSEQGFFFDADGDGNLDLLVTNTARWTTEARDETDRHWLGGADLLALVDSPPERNRLYRSRGDGTFEDATAASGLAGAGWSGDAAIFDADGDGDLDVFVANMFGRSSLFTNDGRGRFVDATAAHLLRTSWGAVGARAFDADGDGRLDLMVVDMHSDMWMPPQFVPTPELDTRKFSTMWGPTRQPPGTEQLVRLRFRADEVLFGNALHVARGGGTYEERSDRAGVETLWPWGVAVADFDGDGMEDVFIPSGMGYPFAYRRSPLLINRGDGTFLDRASMAGLDAPPARVGPEPTIGGRPAARSLRSAATSDLDGDGRIDLVANPFNDRALVYGNRSPARPWVGLRLVGTGKNRDAIGATVRLVAGGKTRLRMVQAAGGYLSQSSAVIHVGLGLATTIDACEIRWPDGTVQQVPGLVPGRVHLVAQPPRTPH